MKEKKKPKPRVHYVAPAPFIPQKKAAPKQDAAEVIYKVIVRTSKRDDAGTSAKVSFTHAVNYRCFNVRYATGTDTDSWT